MMNWDPEKLRDDFVTVAKLGGIEIKPDDIGIETLTMPHRQLRNLPKGKMAVYIFSNKEHVLKVGKLVRNPGLGIDINIMAHLKREVLWQIHFWKMKT